ncbi:proline dehydrogenase family protein [Streptomyces sp. RerS4]|uniref:proline dehydrogenase family protein n=1 Tax=Streptomyces sp. RerS4 TaxID=2942449 RepID=UPI00201C9363|nr:proline dehydrogenase family protein [Streptomyces sp. RerS4]UQX05395.1 proline dehydrogenase family protein [Streptomyces sp. RerS4]
MQELSQRALYEAAAEGLRVLAADPRCLAAAGTPGSALREILAPAALRYVLAPGREEFLQALAVLRAKGYAVTAEFVGEAGAGPAYGERTTEEYLALLGRRAAPERLGVDLFRLGLATSRPGAVRRAARIAAAAEARGGEVVLGMDRAPTVDAVLGVHRQLADRYANLGLTLQAHLHRTEDDIRRVALPGRMIRLVKGEFREPPEVALGRGPALDDRYLHLARRLLDRGVRLSLATQDPDLLAEAVRTGLVGRDTEIEMLHGVRPDLLRHHRDAGRPCRIHAAYGTDWLPHLLRRLAEHPPMVLTALSDLGTRRAQPAGTGY